MGELSPVNLYEVYRWATVVVALAVIGFLLVTFFVRRSQRRARDRSLPLDFSDISALQARGLLTPEEAKKVREALVRKASQPTPAVPPGLKGDAALLADAEVRRLEALAQAKKLEHQEGNKGPAGAERVAKSTSETIPPELRPAVEKGLLTEEEALAIARRSKKGMDR